MRSGLYLLALVAGASAGAAPLSFKNVNLTAPEGFLTGIDVSNYQGQIDWASVATTGISFAMCVAWRGGLCRFSLPHLSLLVAAMGVTQDPCVCGANPAHRHIYYFLRESGCTLRGWAGGWDVRSGGRGCFCKTGHKGCQ
jgi:hypothetical protein